MRRLLVIAIIVFGGVFVFRLCSQHSDSGKETEPVAKDEVSGGGRSNAVLTQPVSNPISRRRSNWPTKEDRFFNPARLEGDANYRRVVWQYWLQRNIDASRQREPQLDVIAKLFETNGIPRELSLELVRNAYVGLSSIQMFEKFSTDAGEDKRVELAKIESENLPNQLKAAQLETMERLQDLVSSNYSSMARAYHDASMMQLQSETGIQDSEFYQKLFSIRLREFATPILTNMADNEPLFGP